MASRIPQLTKFLTGNDVLDRWQDHIVNVLNPVLKLGTTLIQGLPVPAPTVTNDGQVLQYNDASASWVLAAVTGPGGVVPDASTTVKGITRLSVAPASPTSPIAAGDNDPRLSDARTPTGSAGGDLTGSTFPAPTIAAGAVTSGKIASGAVGTTQIASGAVGSAQLATTAVTPGTYGDATHVGAFTVSGDGRLTAASSVAISGGGGGGTMPLSSTVTSFFDDFFGTVPSPIWHFGGSVGYVTGSTPIPANGICVVATASGAGSFFAGIDWNGLPCRKQNKGKFEWRARISTLTTDLNVHFGLADSLAIMSEYIVFFADTTGVSPVWNVRWNTGSGPVSTATTVPVDALFHTFTIDLSGTVAHFLIDGVDTGITTAFTNLPPDDIGPLARISTTAGSNSILLDYFQFTTTRGTL
jgi:hypothetical protein